MCTTLFAKRCTSASGWQGCGMVLLCTLLAGGIATGEQDGMETIDLSGAWRFRLDPDDQGVQEKWFIQELDETVCLPGTTSTNSKGHCRETPEAGRLTRRWHYVGPAWYQRRATIPEGWQGKRLTLFLERCHWVSQVWIGGEAVGMRTSLSTPHVYDLTGIAAPGPQTLTIRIDNRPYVWSGGMYMMDDAQQNWNGIVGRIALEATPGVWVESVQAYPDPARGVVRAVTRIGALESASCQATLVWEVTDGVKTVAIAEKPVALQGRETAAEYDLAMPGDFSLWDEFAPNLYGLRATVRTGSTDHARAVSFGMRELTAPGKQFRLNGRPLFLRGHVDCNIWPDCGYAPMGKGEWLKIMGVLQAYGMNHIRFHSGCPPESCFAAADEAGVILQIENPAWYDPKYAGGTVADDPDRAEFLRAEMNAILSAYGNHPSFCLYAMGNELGPEAEPFQMELVAHGRAADPRHMYTRNSGYMNLDAPQDYFVASHSPTSGHLRLEWLINEERPGTEADYGASIEPIARPVVSHEIAMWNMTANLDEWQNYPGVMAPLFLEQYRDRMENASLLDMAEPFRRSSGAFLVEIWKEEIERQLRTPEKAGFHLLSLYDYPGFGISLNGILDCRWRSKGLIRPEAFRRFCGPVVPLLRMSRRVWMNHQSFSGIVPVANYGPHTLVDAPVFWRLLNSKGEEQARGDLGHHNLPNDGLHKIGVIDTDLVHLKAPGQYTIEVGLSGTEYRNSWRIWVMAAEEAPAVTPGVHVADAWDDETRSILAEGGRVVLLLEPGRLYNAIDGIFAPVFAGWQQLVGQPGTFGIHCDPDHPALRRFPTGTHSDWQWWDLVQGSAALILDAAPSAVVPIVHIIDNHDRCHRLAGLFECRVGPGALLVSAFDLRRDLEKRPAARQFLESIIHYALSEDFEPSERVDSDLLDTLFRSEPKWHPSSSPRADALVALDVQAALGIKQLNYPDGLAWAERLDTVAHRSVGFDYRLTACMMHSEPRIGLHGWRNRWRSYPLTIDITYPRDFKGDLYLEMVNREQRRTPVTVRVNGAWVDPVDFEGYDGRWHRCPLPGQRDGSEPARIELLAEDAYVWVRRIVVCSSTP
jgi:hypothetical protein